MAPPAEPDLAGFADAQDRLRDHFGELVVFIAPTEHTWPSGTPIDPETGQPYDPVVAAQGSASSSSAALYANVAARPYGRADVEWTSVGARDVDEVMLIADTSASAVMASAASFVVRDTSYKLSSWQLDGVGGVQRAIAFGRQR